MVTFSLELNMDLLRWQMAMLSPRGHAILEIDIRRNEVKLVPECEPVTKDGRIIIGLRLADGYLHA